MAIKQTIPNYTNTNKSLTLGNFKGIDASSSPFEVDISRATYCENLINENGVNHKRPGWKTIKILENSIAVFHITFEGNDYMIVVNKVETPTDNPTDLYAVIKLYKFNKSEFKMTEIDSINLLSALIRYTDYGSKYYSRTYFELTNVQCFVQNNVAYLIGFDKFLLITKEKIITCPTKSIANGVPDGAVYFYIPTTTISINRDSEVTATRKEKEHANLLSLYRKNTLVGAKSSESSDGTEII